jgi:hypothetical protein
MLLEYAFMRHRTQYLVQAAPNRLDLVELVGELIRGKQLREL